MGVNVFLGGGGGSGVWQLFLVKNEPYPVLWTKKKILPTFEK
jgi:hypothetical protein